MSGLPHLDVFAAEPGPRTVSKGGRPAPCVPHAGMPAYESETGALLVMETLVAFFGRADSGAPLLMPHSYMMATLRAPSGLTALHDDPDAVWSWRPCIYTLKVAVTERMGSQQELEYRRGLHDVHMASADLQDQGDAFIVEQCVELKRRYGRLPPLTLEPGERRFRLPKNARKRMHRAYVAHVEGLNAAALEAEMPYQAANRKAEALLREHLSPLQLIEFVCEGGFHVRGTINWLYRISVGNGASIVDPVTHEPVVSLCIHPDDWIPDEDVALSLKMMIESGPEGEAEMLAGARARPLRRASGPTAADRRAWEIERDLLPAPLPAV